MNQKIQLDPFKNLWTLDEVSEILECCVSTIQHKLKNRELYSCMQGKDIFILRWSLEEYMNINIHKYAHKFNLDLVYFEWEDLDQFIKDVQDSNVSFLLDEI